MVTRFKKKRRRNHVQKEYIRKGIKMLNLSEGFNYL